MKRARVDQIIRLAVARATLGDVCDRLAKAYGARVALTSDDEDLSYVDVADRVARMAGALASRGVKKGERVAVCTANRIDYALACFAAVRAGAVAIPLHHHLKPNEIEAFTKRSQARFLVAETKLDLPCTVLDIEDLDAEPIKPIRVAPDDAALILFTSGTTGSPKGATLSSRAMLSVARLATLVPDARNESGICGLPLAHVMGMSTLLCALLAGAPMHWVTKFDAKRILELIETRKPTFFIGVPAMYSMMAEAEPESVDLSSVRLFASGADAMPPALIERFRKLGCAVRSPRGKLLFTAAFAEIYGMVELSGPAILKVTPPEPFEDAPIRSRVRKSRISARLSSARDRVQKQVRALAGGRQDERAALGIPIPPYRAKIVDDNGRAVKPGVVGELVLKGPGVTKGYDADPQATARTTHDGWLRTGDLAWKNRFGFIAFATRKKDVIKHGGYSVFPAEVEAQLTEHPQIAEAVVFGVPHPTKGAQPAAAVVVRGDVTVEELLAWSRDNIASYKAPRVIAIVGAADIPRNANKKVLKDELRSLLLARGAIGAIG